MNTRTKLIIASVGLLLAIACSTPSAEAQNLLVDPGFSGTPALTSDATVLGPPFVLGQWGAESGAIVGSTNGVTPLSAPTMLEESYSYKYTQTFQVTQVSSSPTGLPAGYTSTLSAYFDVGGIPAGTTGATGGLGVSFFDASSNPVGIPLPTAYATNVGTTGWEQITQTGTIPSGTEYIVSQVFYDSTTLPLDTTGATLPGFVDDASLTVTTPEPCTLVVWSLLGACGMGFGWRRRKAGGAAR